jgi:DNA mismatch endonuclease (patch repair protein)
MVDHVSTEKRSQIMASIKSKNTEPELLIRKILYAAGYRYRLHGIKLPGKPDIVMRKYKAAIFIHGCFWHGHGCNLSKGLPKTRKEFWESKIINNKARDERNVDQLLSEGWRVCTIWDCALQRKK